jgi:hypothetical protein
MEREDVAKLRADEPATVMVDQTAHHFAALKDAAEFALNAVPPGFRGKTWVLVDRGLLAPEDLQPVLSRIAA